MIKIHITKDFIFLLIPLILSSYTHLWNPIGFPAIHPDEGVYMRRAMLVMKNLGPYDPAAHFDHIPATSSSSYDHPFFGQIFLAGALGVIGYPHSLNPSPDLHSIEMLYIVPRILMGLLAVLDTFLLYKIAEYRHGRNVALFSSVIFAVMPLSWLLRWILLDSILLPFLLASILLAIYIKRRKNLHNVDTNDDDNNSISSSSNIKIPIILLSGILLGLAIYTKIPAFTMIPLVGFLVYTNSNKSLKALGLWFLPVILIPAMWPVYSISAGQFDEWEEGILHQVNRTGISVLASAKAVFQIDPVIMMMGISGIILSVIKKDYIYLLWILPFAVFSAIGYFQYFHVILLLPAISIGSGILLEVFLQISTKKGILQKYLALTSILAITIFGLVTSSLLITMNVNNSYFDIYTSVVQQITKSNNTDVGFNKFMVLGNHWWIYNTLWIPVYVFDKNFEFVEAPDIDNSDNKVMNNIGIVMIVDNPLRDKIGNTHLSNITIKYPKSSAVISNAYNLTRELTSYIDSVNPSNQTGYPYNSLSIMIASERKPMGKIDIRTNY